ncbi:MAG: hypothetical protein ACK5ZJ_08525 [Acidobacteriota bacterium]
MVAMRTVRLVMVVEALRGAGGEFGESVPGEADHGEQHLVDAGAAEGGLPATATVTRTPGPVR